MFEEKLKRLWLIFLMAPMTEQKNEVPLKENSTQKFLEKERKFLQKNLGNFKERKNLIP